jgi:AmmeMemoRadiSam system protein A
MYDDKQREILLEIARNSIKAKLEHKTVAPPQDIDEALKQKRAAFVTLTKQKELRGCIGFIKAVQPLYQTVEYLAKAAAFEDPRFPAVKFNELEEISIEISVLSEMEPIAKDSFAEIEIGKHGLYIEGKRGSGLLLPQVAVEQGWTKEEFLYNICLKAGLHPNAYTLSDNKLYTFTAEIFSENS